MRETCDWVNIGRQPDSIPPLDGDFDHWDRRFEHVPRCTRRLDCLRVHPMRLRTMSIVFDMIGCTLSFSLAHFSAGIQFSYLTFYQWRRGKGANNRRKRNGSL